MSQHNWDQIIADLKKHPGEWTLVAELAQGGKAVQRLRDAGMEIRKERVTSKLFNLYARCPEPNSQLNFTEIEAHERHTLEARVDAAHAEAEAAAAHHQAAQEKLSALLAELKASNDQRKG